MITDNYIKMAEQAGEIQKVWIGIDLCILIVEKWGLLV